MVRDVACFFFSLSLISGPGQHIRPAPSFGPGSMSQSGLVDYSNVFVKVALVKLRELIAEPRP